MGAREPYAAVRGKNLEKASWLPSRRPFPSQATCSPLGLPLVLTSIVIGVVPTEAKIVAMRYDDATERVRELARAPAVDGWYTSDHTHFAQIASHRR
jgi:hypothetical protein